ncbi:uncharacterized protein [Gossypium hirsutum]|uniref:Uncharacterized protein isoform X2 n=1 Tax=Gossypium hirsutum TaxID=3635 RepID=A0ABM3B9B7_GOSHI|nr:uncharacterized protein LOC107947278 isoform X2 [Gossypium hirsutum]
MAASNFLICSAHLFHFLELKNLTKLFHSQHKMGCKFISLEPPILYQIPVRTTPPCFRTKAIAFSSYAPNKGEPVSTKLPLSKTNDVYSVSFKTLGACKLGISRYPDFEYNAQGGTGTGTGSKVADSDELSVDLEFLAKFCFSVGSIYEAPPLVVKTVLTSDESKGKMRSGRGERLDEEGNCKLVGVAFVEPIDDVFMNTFLSLPTECLAKLNAVITLSKSS